MRQNPERGIKALYDTYWEQLYHYTLQVTTCSDSAKEIIQSLFVALWEDHQKLAKVTHLKSYLYRAVKNNILRYMSDHRFTSLHLDVIERLPDASDSEEIEQSSNQHLLQQRLAVLPTRRREVFELSRYQQLTHHQIAQRLQISIHTVEKHITNALAALRA